MNKINYEIRPIFQPSGKICKDFARVHISRLSASEQEKLNSNQQLSILTGCQGVSFCNKLESAYLNTWNMEKNVFAFAAYSAEEMVGFIMGALRGKNMFTRSLYVVPQYQRYGIGSNLLDYAERAASCVALNMELYSLDGSVNFYQRHGYKNVLVLERIMKIKKLPNVTGVLPVFQWSDKLQAKLNVKFDIDLLKQKYQPIFVYVNEEHKIDAVAVRMQNGKEKIKINTKKKELSDFYNQQLSDALSRSL